MSFDYAKFKEEITSDYSHYFNPDEIANLLDLDDNYESRDTPISTGKRLLVTSIHFKGVKTNGIVIDFSQQIQSGVNIWIADNLKGKSSLFKIIQLALTGDNNLKHDLKKWITSILVNFSINDKQFSVYMCLKRPQLTYLYGKGFDCFEEVEKSQLDPIFVATTIDDYQKEIEKFFFNQFSYYSLKWTQKDSRKDVNELHDASASWKTYFKSIFLESRDSDKLMYGDQGKKVFQMLLGLQLTYPINRLTIKKERFEFERGNLASVRKSQTDQYFQKMVLLQNRLSEIDRELTQYNSAYNHKLNIQQLYSEYTSILNDLKSKMDMNISIQEKLDECERAFRSKASEKENLGEEKSRLQKELQKSQKARMDIQEYIDIGIFFSNLDIKHCPNCDHDISTQRKEMEKSSKQCSLCSEPIDENKKVDIEAFQERIVSLQRVEKNYEREIANIQNTIQRLDAEREALLRDKNRLQSQKILVQEQETKNRLFELEKLINHEKEIADPNEKYKDNLIAEKAVIEFQLKDISGKSSKEAEDVLGRRIEVLASAIERLKKQRSEFGKKILEHLSSLMLSQINALGLKSITEVKISDGFDISYKQDNDYVEFSDIVEGEQLRVKIAFYLSLIQLDIDHNFGRHTRFLIIDSPSKEEGDANYLEGFTGVLRMIESQFGDQLQILIGTAERELSNIITNQKIVPPGEYLF